MLINLHFISGFFARILLKTLLEWISKNITTASWVFYKFYREMQKAKSHLNNIHLATYKAH